MKILVNGARGRMGRMLLERAPALAAEVTAAIDVGDDPAPLLERAEVAIDFSHHTATAGLAALAARLGKPLVVGTTGHSPDERAAILACTDRIPLVWSGNYSIGVNLLFYLTEAAARVLPTTAYAAEIVELHHRHKIDAPSGTAVHLLEALQKARPLESNKVRHGRSGITGARPDDEVAVHAVRGGDVVGEHTVYFFGEGERVELTHRATNRAIFADGALAAARWVIGQPPGLYTMREVLGFSS